MEHPEVHGDWGPFDVWLLLASWALLGLGALGWGFTLLSVAYALLERWSRVAVLRLLAALALSPLALLAGLVVASTVPRALYAWVWFPVVVAVVAGLWATPFLVRRGAGARPEAAPPSAPPGGE